MSSDWMYFTCGSMASWSSSGREEEPARPGPETSDILEGVLSFSSGIGSVEENVVSEIGENGDALGLKWAAHKFREPIRNAVSLI